MEKRSRIQQIYGYAVCLVTVITFLISLTSLVINIIDLGDPLHAERGFESLASFEIYKIDVLKSLQKEGESSVLPDDQTLHAMYKDSKAEAIQAVLHRAHRSIIVESLLIILCGVFFSTHFMWVRKPVSTEM